MLARGSAPTNFPRKASRGLGLGGVFHTLLSGRLRLLHLRVGRVRKTGCVLYSARGFESCWPAVARQQISTGLEAGRGVPHATEWQAEVVTSESGVRRWLFRKRSLARFRAPTIFEPGEHYIVYRVKGYIDKVAKRKP